MATEPPRRRRHSPAVYRRRRIVLLVGILAVVAVVWLLIAQPWRGSAAQSEALDPGSGDKTASDAGVTELPVPQNGSSTPTPSATASARPSPSATPSQTAEAGKPAASPAATAAAKPCKDGDIVVEPLTDKESYASGQNPLLSIKLTNNGTTDCTLNVGTSAQAFTITSGSDTWWRSTDCQTEPSDMVVLLKADQTVKSAVPLTWDRTRSSVGTCSNTDRPRAPGGGASYHLAVEIGGISSTESAQILLY